jgi:hypothetical protein
VPPIAPCPFTVRAFVIAIRKHESSENKKLAYSNPFTTASESVYEITQARIQIAKKVSAQG